MCFVIRHMNKIIICGIGVGVTILIISVIYLPGIDGIIYLEERKKMTILVEEIIDDRDCFGINDLLKSGKIDGIQERRAAAFSQHCKYVAEINDEGIDISDTFTRSYTYP